VTIEVFAKAATQQTREDIARNAGLSIAEIDRPGEMLDENGAGKAILAHEGRRCEKRSGHADVGFVMEPEDVKGASTVFEPRQEGLNGMNGMQELEAICAATSSAWRGRATDRWWWCQEGADGGGENLQSKSTRALSRQYVNSASPWIPKRLAPAKSPTMSTRMGHNDSSRRRVSDILAIWWWEGL